MAKRAHESTSIAQAQAEAPKSSQVDLAPAIVALTQATQSLALAANQLMQFAQGFAGLPLTGRSGPLGGIGEAGSGFPALAQVNAWEDDAFSEAVPTPNPSNPSPIA